MADTSLIVAGTFQERIFDKIKESIGDLMSEEDLKRLVEAALQDAFFKERVTKNYQFGSTSEVKPPVLVELVEKLLRERVRVAVDAWLATNQDKLAPLIQKMVDDGLCTMLRRILEDKTQQAMWLLGEHLKQALAGKL